MKKSNLYIALFLSMAVIYGGFSSSSPENIGVAELYVGLCLIVLVGLSGLRNVIIFDGYSQSGPLAMAPDYVKLSVVYLLLVPTLYGIIIVQNNIGDFVRDFIPLVYMFMPLLLLHRVTMVSKKWLIVVVLWLSVVGLLFSVRFLLDTKENLSAIGSQLVLSTNRDNTMQAPATLFFHSFSSCLGLWLLLNKKRIIGIIVTSVAIIPWTVMFASVMRAPVAITAFAMLLTALRWMMRGKEKKRTVIFIFIIIVPCFVLYGQPLIEIVKSSIELLLYKQQEQGVTSRLIESKAVLENASVFSTLLFGEGWGGVIANPVGGGAYWRFVHNMFIYFIFKIGVFGLPAVAIYLYWIACYLFKVSLKDDLVFLVLVSMMSPLVIAMFLEPTFKTLSFGIVLLLFPLMAISFNQKHNTWKFYEA